MIGILLFADDIVRIPSSPSDLASLSSILESWCSDFEMLVSVAKTNVISPDEDFECSVSCDGISEAAVISQVASYKYLGVNQYLEPNRTSHHVLICFGVLNSTRTSFFLAGAFCRIKFAHYLLSGVPWLSLASITQ